MGAGHQDLVLFRCRHSMQGGPRGGSTFEEIGRFRRFGGSRCRGGRRNLVRVDLGFANEGHALLDDEFGGADVAKHFGLGFDFNFFLGVDVAVDLAAHDDGLRGNVAADDGAIAEHQRAVSVDLALKFAFKGQFAVEFEVAFDFNVRIEDVLARIDRVCVHVRFHNSGGFILVGDLTCGHIALFEKIPREPELFLRPENPATEWQVIYHQW